MTTRSAILSTLCYHDLFDYPLTQSEISKLLIGNSKAGGLTGEQIQEKNGFFFLTGREKIVKIRQRREKISAKKLAIAHQISRWLQLIPSIKMIAVTGAVAVKNAKTDDDIDLLIITRADRLWLTRFFSLLLIEVLGKRRKPQDVDVCDKICLNIWLDEKKLALPKSKRNLFTAHEIYQMITLYQKDNLYQQFLKANQWSIRFLPNWKK